MARWIQPIRGFPNEQRDAAQAESVFIFAQENRDSAPHRSGIFVYDKEVGLLEFGETLDVPGLDLLPTDEPSYRVRPVGAAGDRIFFKDQNRVHYQYSVDRGIEELTSPLPDGRFATSTQYMDSIFEFAGRTYAVAFAEGDTIFEAGLELVVIRPNGNVVPVDVDRSQPGIQTIFPGPDGSDPENFIILDDVVYFNAMSSRGYGLFYMTADGTIGEVDERPDVQDVQPLETTIQAAVAIHGELYFSYSS